MIGRAIELSALSGRLARGVRLLTIFGPGGIGKTTLARALVEAHASAVFVPLTAADDVQQATVLVARALEVRASTHEEIRDRVLRRLSDGATLVLDNLEHLPSIAELLDDWTSSAPRLSVVATSRTRVGLPYEDVVEIGPLAPDDGVELFLQRAGLDDPGASAREAIGAIVRALDGVPLAIELAAGRTRDLPIAALAAGTHDLHWLTGESRAGPERHRSIDGLVAWSWDRLDEAGREAMIELSAYRGGMSLELAARWPALRHLRDQGLVSLADGRYRLLEIVRAFVQKHADTGPARRRHAELFVDEASRRGGLLPTARAEAWLREELENLRCAAVVAATDAALALRSALALDAALYLAALPRGPEMLEAALVHDAEPADRARALCRISAARYQRGECDVGLAERAWELAEQTGDLDAQAWAVHELLEQYVAAGRAPEGAELARRFGDAGRIDPYALRALRTTAVLALSVRELLDIYPRWLEECPRPFELSNYAFVLALAGEGQRAMEVLPDDPAAVHWRGVVLLAAAQFEEAALACALSADTAQKGGAVRLHRWSSILAELARAFVSGDVRVAIDACIADLVEVDAHLLDCVLAAAILGSKRARARLAIERSKLTGPRCELALEALEALARGDRERAERCSGMLKARALDMPAANAFHAILIHYAVEARLRASNRRVLTVGPNIEWFRVGEAPAAHLATYDAPRRVLAALLDAPQGADALFAAGWPGQRASASSARTRVRVTLARLRKLGLDSVIERGPGVWRIARDVQVVRSTEADPAG